MNSPSPLQGLEPSTNCIEMPKKSSSQSSKNTKKAARPMASGRQVRPGTLISGAPVAVAVSRQQFVHFGQGERKDSLRMKCRINLADVQRISTAAQGNGLFDGTQAFVSEQLNLTAPMGLTGAGTKTAANWISPIFDLIASAFTRYRVRGLKFHYCPQSSTTTGERLIFAFANDPVHPVLWNSTPPTAAALESLADSVPFGPWETWSLDCTDRVAQDVLFTYSDPSTSVGQITERFSDFGVIALVTSSASGANTACGVLQMELDVELMEFCPITTTRPTLLARLAKRVKCHLELKSVRKDGPPQEDMEREQNEPSNAETLCEAESPLDKLRRRLRDLEARAP